MRTEIAQEPIARIRTHKVLKQWANAIVRWSSEHRLLTVGAAWGVALSPLVIAAVMVAVYAWSIQSSPLPRSERTDISAIQIDAMIEAITTLSDEADGEWGRSFSRDGVWIERGDKSLFVSEWTKSWSRVVTPLGVMFSVIDGEPSIVIDRESGNSCQGLLGDLRKWHSDRNFLLGSTRIDGASFDFIRVPGDMRLEDQRRFCERVIERNQGMILQLTRDR